jgi:hypothetical protein
MLAPSRIKQQRLGYRIPAFVGAFEQQAADRFRPLRAARLTAALRRDAGAAQRRRQQVELGGFSGPLPALDRDEAAARRRRA